MSETDVCESCAADPTVTLADDPNDGHEGGYGSIDPCERCGDGRAGSRYRATSTFTAVA